MVNAHWLDGGFKPIRTGKIFWKNKLKRSVFFFCSIYSDFYEDCEQRFPVDVSVRDKPLHKTVEVGVFHIELYTTKAKNQ